MKGNNLLCLPGPSDSSVLCAGGTGGFGGKTEPISDVAFTMALGVPTDSMLNWRMSPVLLDSYVQC